MEKAHKILVTGAAGFIGFHTCLALKDHAVVGLDNFDPYYSVKLKKERAKQLSEAGITVLEADINDAEFLGNLMEKENFSHIIHLAAQAGVRYSLENPQAYLKSNIDGFLSILELVRKNPAVKLIYASSSSVYGQNEKTPFALSDRTDNQASLYGVTKKTNELMAEAYHHLFDLDIVGLRFFTVYGPWGRPDMAYYSFADAIQKNKVIKLYNFGKCKRDFTYIDDIVKGILSCLTLEKGNFLFNLGNNQPVELIDFVEILESQLLKKAKKELLPLQPGDVISTWADIDVSRQKLHYEPKTSLREGLSRFVEWFKNYNHSSEEE